MPLDGHSYLVSQGWQGKGSGLRHGAINRPVIIAQKKTLSGVGKDRDEAFPFWDHVFSAAVNAVKIKVYNSDSEDTDTESSNTPVEFQRTKTGIISNRRPTTSTPASHSGTATPSSADASGSSTPRISIMAAAKQEAARRTLYSMFFRGPILGSDIVEEMAKVEIKDDEVVEAELAKDVEADGVKKREKKDKKRKRDHVEQESTERAEKKKKKGTKASKKGKEVAMVPSEDVGDEAIDVDIADELTKKERKRRRREKDIEQEEDEAADTARREKAERKRLRAEKRARKEEKRKRREQRKALKTRDEEQPESSSPPVSTPIEDNVASEGETRKQKHREKKSKKKRGSEAS